MEGKKHLLILVLLIFISLIAEASYKNDIYNAFISGDMKKWKTVIDQLDKQSNKSNQQYLELLEYQYGYIAYCIGNKDETQAKYYYEKGKEIISRLEKNGYELANVYAYKSAFYGYAIGFKPYQAPVLGPKSIHYARESVKIDKSNSHGYTLLGHIKYYMPVVFGGSKKEAIDYYRKAETLMENDKEKIKDDWNYVGLLTTIAVAYSEVEDYNHARLYFEKIIKIEPELHWVKNELYPEFLKKIK